MKRFCFFLLAFVLLRLSAAPRPIMDFDFSKTKEDGTVPNLSSEKYPAKVQGKYKVLPGGILKMDGLTTRVLVSGTEDLDVSKNMTFSLLYRGELLEDNDSSNRNNDGFFSKSGVFIMTKYKKNFYGNIHDGKKWNATCQIFDAFRDLDTAWHHVVMSIEYFRNWNEAEEWVEFRFYIDGVCVGKQRFKDVRIRKNKKLLEIGSNSGMGPSWMLGGEIAEPKVFDRVLSEAEVRELTLSQKLAKPAFKLEKKCSPEDLAAIRALKIPDSLKHALENIAVMDSEHVVFRKILEAPEKYLTKINGSDSDLVIVHTKNFAHICSWYDRRAGRELFKADNPFVEWQFTSKAGTQTLHPLDKGVTSSLKGKPVRGKDGEWEFRIEYRKKTVPAFSGYSDYVFRNDRLEFRHNAATEEDGCRLFSVSFPKFSFQSFSGSGETLVVPYGCGVPYPQPTKNNIRYSNPYPRAFCCMQCVSYYDQAGGLYVATEDPNGRQKQVTFTCAKGRVDGEYVWRVPYADPKKTNVFDPGCRAAAELFRGDWYEAGLIYRRILGEIKARWWRPELPNTDTPEYFRNNSIWIAATYLGEYDESLFALREYFGQDFYLGDIWKWWEEGICVNLSPTMRAAPEWIEFVRQLRKKGIRCQPYIDGRLWAEKDRRGEDYLFSAEAHKLNVISDGVPIRELYKNPCDVLCPATAGYQKHFFEFIKTITMQGLDGLYIDQMGAAYQPLCHAAAEHGHLYADWDAWYSNGYEKLIRNLRQYWKAHGTEKVLSTEDNAEMLVGLLDAMEVYRWSTEGQIPLFPLVYSGRTQFYNRHARTKDARFQTVAEQLVNSEQLGSFGTGELISPFNADLRQYVKRLVWLRTAMLDFFNAGRMCRPGYFPGKMPVYTRFWSDFGTQRVTKPQVQSGVWQYGPYIAAVLVNTEAIPYTGTFSFSLPDGEYLLEPFYSVPGKTTTTVKQKRRAEFHVELEPRECLLIFACPVSSDGGKTLSRIRKAFVTIRKTYTEKDPFGVENLPETERINPRNPMLLTDSKMVIGARRNRTFNRIDYVSHALIYPGTVDFGKESPKEIFLETACGTPQGGKIEVYVDGITPEHRIAEVILSPDFRTKSWNDFVPLRAAVQKPLTGTHKIIFAVRGLGFCNLKHWYVK